MELLNVARFPIRIVKYLTKKLKVMSKFKGTKGKWTTFKQNHIGCTNVSFSEHTEFEPFIELWHHQFENRKTEAEANAKLISCAPEMLEMLEKVCKKLNGNGFPMLQTEIEQLIKKATEI